MSEILATIDGWVKVVAAAIAAAMAFLVPFWAWRKEERTYREQREASARAAETAKLNPTTLPQPTAALYVDQRSLDSIILAIERHGIAMDRNTNALTRMADRLMDDDRPAGE